MDMHNARHRSNRRGRKIILLGLLLAVYIVFATSCSQPPAISPTIAEASATVSSPGPTSTATSVLAVSQKQPRGYLTTPQELAVIKRKADQGIEPYKSAVANVLKQASKHWDFKLAANATCSDHNHPAWLDNEGGMPILYGKALAYRLTNDAGYANDVRNILQRIVTEVKTISLEDQQCRLNFGWGTPEMVASADLIEGYWNDQTCTGPVSTLYDDTTIDNGPCKWLFQNWLVKNPYYAVSFSASGGGNNWGAAATNTTAYIADYLWDRPDAKLIHRNPNQINDGKDLPLSPAQAYKHANTIALKRMSGYGVEYGSGSSCDYLGDEQQNSQWTPVKSQITERGIIPEDARREEFCNIPQYSGHYENYPQLHIGHNIAQCELMLRRGDRSCYDNVDNTDIPNYAFVDPKGVKRTTHLYPGRGSLERAIDAIIVDSHTEWKHDSALRVAYRYYYHYHRLAGFEAWAEQLSPNDGCSQDICFGGLTHGFNSGEDPELPPTISPP